jgi:hypothetical protein
MTAKSSETPRTDAYEKDYSDCTGDFSFFHGTAADLHRSLEFAWMFSRQLERELTAAQAKIEALRRDAERYAAKEARRGCDKPLILENAWMEDAERYRFLRKQHWDSAGLCVVTEPKLNVKPGTYCPSEELLDDAIDAAREQA